jgi:cardiolipin synthase
LKRNVPINVPNALTLLRVLLTPLFAIFLINGYFNHALLVFAVAAFTDAVDGLIARLFRQKTTLGAFLDPAADKLLLVTAFLTLAIQALIPSWLAVIVISRDIVILFGVALVAITGHTLEPKPSMLSKITTVAQLACVISVLLGYNLSRLDGVKGTLFWFTAIMTVISGLHYIYMGLTILQEEP